MNQQEARRLAREDIKQALHDHAIKCGQLPNSREIEKQALEVGDRVDSRHDRGEGKRKR